MTTVEGTVAGAFSVSALASLTCEAARSEVPASGKSDFEDAIRSAAERIAAGHHGIDADALTGLFDASEVEAEIEAFETAGEPVSVGVLADELRSQVIGVLTGDAETVLLQFVETLETELVALPEEDRRWVMTYLRESYAVYAGQLEGQPDHELEAILDRFDDFGDARPELVLLRERELPEDERVEKRECSWLDDADFDEPERYHEKSLERYREVGDRGGEARSLRSLGESALRRGEFDESERYHQKSLERFRESGDEAGEADSLFGLGDTALGRGELAEARTYHEECLELFREVGNSEREARSLGILGNIAEETGDYEAALEYYAATYDAFEELGALREVLQTVKNLAKVSEELGDDEGAAEWYTTGIERLTEPDVPRLDGWFTRFMLGRAAVDPSPDWTKELYGQALDRVLKNDSKLATQFFQATWNRRPLYEPTEPIYDVCQAAGVGFAFHLQLLEGSGAADAGERAQGVLDEIDDGVDLSPGMAAVYEQLRAGSSDVTPAGLRGDSGNEASELESLEAEAAGKMLELLAQ